MSDVMFWNPFFQMGEPQTMKWEDVPAGRTFIYANREFQRIDGGVKRIGAGRPPKSPMQLLPGTLVTL